MFPHFFQVCKRRLLTFEDSTHTSKCGTLEAFAPVERITVFDHTDHITCNGIDEGFRGVDLSKGEFVVILVVESVAQIGVERVDVVKAREVGEHCSKAFRDCLLSEFNFAHAERETERVWDGMRVGCGIEMLE